MILNAQIDLRVRFVEQFHDSWQVNQTASQWTASQPMRAFWLEIIADSGLVPCKRVEPLHQEATELVAIMAASGKTARRRRD